MRDGPRGFRQDYTCPALLRIPQGPVRVHVQDCHLLWPDFPDRSIPHQGAKTWSYNPGDASPQRRFGLIPGRSPLLGESFSYFLLLRVLRCFSSPRSPPCEKAWMTVLQTAGLSHSEIAGSRVICTYPALIAAYHVLHRLREPRHPPCALTYLCRMHDYCPTPDRMPRKPKQGNCGKRPGKARVDMSLLSLVSCL